MGQLPFTSFVSDQWSRLPPVLTADLTGKTVIVVGVYGGIGLAAAKHFARMKPVRLVLACRKEHKAKDAVQRIAKLTGYRAEAQLVDLGNFASVVAFAKRLENEPVDILVANAGVSLAAYQTTKHGWEETIHVNHLSTAILSLVLLPNLALASSRATHISTPRIVIVGSEVHFWTKLEPEIVNAPGGLLMKLSDREYCTEKVMARRYFDSTPAHHPPRPQSAKKISY